MFQFAKFEKSKERRLATELGDGFPIGDPWITDGISPWPFAFESVLPSQCPGIHPMHSSLSCTGYTEDQLNLDIKREKPPSDPHDRRAGTTEAELQTATKHMLMILLDFR
ncbi:hypothetical protein NC651_036194 [Populus alba x Populus x berolinensis]|nr:hypothetical protein NC651_036194 [Populus alba x Populus x berolinensis]